MDNIILALQEAIVDTNGVFFVPKDGSDIHITTNDACTLVSVHDTLTEENQEKMRSMLSESEEDYTKILNFCNKQFNEE